jgi:diaminopimelate epimerase
MRLSFSKMQGAGNDFVVIDATQTPFALSPQQLRRLADRRFGVGADQILVVEPPPPGSGADFRYRIFNADGGEVEQCGNGARCFVRFVRERGLTQKDSIRVATLAGLIEPVWLGGGQVRVDMGQPSFSPESLPFDTQGLQAERRHHADVWRFEAAGRQVRATVVSMGNPHAVLLTDQFDHPAVDDAPVDSLGPAIEAHRRFPKHVNVGFMQVLSRDAVALRVFERGVGETLACGTGACAAVVAGIQLGLLDSTVRVQAHGGELEVGWHGAAVSMSGPAETVFEADIEI